MRLEGATRRRRDRGVDLKKAKIVTIKTVVNVVYNTDEQNISEAQINSQIKAHEQGLPRHQSRQERRRRRRGRAWSPTRASSSSWSKVTRTKTTQDRLHLRRRGEEGGDRRHRARSRPKTHLNLWVCPLSGGLLGYAQFPGGPAAHRRRRDQLPGVRHHRHRAGAVQQGPHRDARGRPLLQPAPHLGRHARLQRLRHGRRHAELRRPELPACRRFRSSPATTVRTATCS